jgi:hypothetical protein
MNSKLTLSLDKQIIKEAKAMAAQRGQSLSALIENHLRSILLKQEKLSEKSNPEGELTPGVAALLGSVKGTKGNHHYKNEINQYREEKWGQ